MHTCIALSEFCFLDFMCRHAHDLVIFVSGSWHYETHTGYYQYQTRYEWMKTPTRAKDLIDLKSSNRAMLEAALAACSCIKYENKNVFILAPTSLGFKRGEKSKGPNADLVNRIFATCADKHLELNTISITGGGQLIKDILSNKL